MKKCSFWLRLALVSVVLTGTSLVSFADLVISQDDFDGNASGLFPLEVNGSLSATVVADPTDATNMVAEIDIATGGVWGTYFQESVDMASNGISTGDTIEYTYDVYIPDDGAGNAVTNAGPQDRVSMIMRWGDTTAVPNPGNTTLDVDRFNTPGHATNIPPGAWLTITNQMTIPADNLVADPPVPSVDTFVPIWSFYDDNNTDPSTRAVPGTTLYVDNWELKVLGIVTALSCDFNSDSQCDIADLDLLYPNWGVAGGQFDVDGNGSVDAGDIGAWLTSASLPGNPYLGGTKTFEIGDVDLDGDVDSTDLGLLLNNFGDMTGKLFGAGNLNDDMNVDSTDLGLLLNKFGATSASASAVPEPSGLGILLVLSFGLFGANRRFKV